MTNNEFPNAVELEVGVLGAVLLESESYELVSQILKPEHFYDNSNSLIYKAIIELANNHTPIDLLTVSQQLKKNKDLEKIGGAYHLSTLTNRIASAANIEYHARIVQQKYLLRRLIEISHLTTSKAFEPSVDCFELLDNSINELNSVLNVIDNKQAKSITELKEEVIYDCNNGLYTDKVSGVPQSITSLYNHTNGWRNSDLIILAGRPGMGKTAVALDFALYPALNHNIPVAFFSLEMSAKQLTGRILSNLSWISASKINNNQVNKDELEALIRDGMQLNNTPLFIDDTPSLTINSLRSKAFKLKREKGIQLIIIDYLQLMDGANSKDNREQEISKISRGLKKLAKELDVPVMALSQLSRQVEARQNKMPMLSDLRDSGAIEQDADMIIFPYRPEYYGIDIYEFDGNEISARDLIILNIAKYRNGAVGELRCKWIGANTSIKNYDYDQQSSLQPNNDFL